MNKNDNPDFIGIDKLKKEHAQQVAQFEIWARGDQWHLFHSSHYDWWVFPIDKPSSHGLKYSVYEAEVSALKADPEFVRQYMKGLSLVAASWGWDIEKEDFLAAPHPEQKWHDWPIRLYKAVQSLILFGFEKEFASLKKLASILIERGENFYFGSKDLKPLFIEKIND